MIKSLVIHLTFFLVILTKMSIVQIFIYIYIYIYIYESSICVQNTLEQLDPQFTKYQFKLNVKQLMCGI